MQRPEEMYASLAEFLSNSNSDEKLTGTNRSLSEVKEEILQLVAGQDLKGALTKALSVHKNDAENETDHNHQKDAENKINDKEDAEKKKTT